jgi:hypothetical protein
MRARTTRKRVEETKDGNKIKRRKPKKPREKKTQAFYDKFMLAPFDREGIHYTSLEANGEIFKLMTAICTAPFATTGLLSGIMLVHMHWRTRLTRSTS